MDLASISDVDWRYAPGRTARPPADVRVLRCDNPDCRAWAASEKRIGEINNRIGAREAYAEAELAASTSREAVPRPALARALAADIKWKLKLDKTVAAGAVGGALVGGVLGGLGGVVFGAFFGAFMGWGVSLWS